MTIDLKNGKPYRKPEVYKLINQIKNIKKRNLVRGYVSMSNIGADQAMAIRQSNTCHDSLIAGALLKGANSILGNAAKKKSKKITSEDLFRMTSFPAVNWKNEICYTAGYINSVKEETLKAIAAIQIFCRLEHMQTLDALNELTELVNNFGASNFLSYKLSYIRSARQLDASQLDIVANIEDKISHRIHAGFHFSALENVSSKISLFVVARRRIAGLVGTVDGDLRKALSLSNFVPTPLDQEDVAGLLLRATELCLIDSIHLIIIILNLQPNWPDIAGEIELRIDREILTSLRKLISFADSTVDGELITDSYRTNNVDSEKTLDLYRISSAFLERPRYALYRNNLDKVVGARLLAEIIGDNCCNSSEPLNEKKLLLAPNGTIVSGVVDVPLDSFYRTYLFLRYIENRANISSLSKDEIKFIFENTIGLEVLLSEKEMRAFYLTAPAENKSLIGVLALALFRKKSIDPDVDFDFRADFIQHIKTQNGGSIIEFIERLLDDSPQVANYIAGSLDEVTLEKMYTLVKDVSQASEIRCEILRTIGKKLNRIEYFIEADAITTRNKVSTLQNYFDSSRMYVDSIAMKKWLDTNPTISTEQYRSLHPRLVTNVSSIEGADGSAENILLIKVSEQDEYLITQVAKDAFEQFCLNTEFGIESYLGRRIRHNTLDGVTTETIDAVFNKEEYRILLLNPQMRHTAEAWTASYKAIIEKLRREYLQFKSPTAFFRHTLDLNDPATSENLRQLAATLLTAGVSDLLNELVIAFCWKQISPQLENAASVIKNTLLNEANASIDRYFLGHFGSAEERMKAELHVAVNDVLRKVADWFRLPRTGFISASIKNLCEIIFIDLNKTGAGEFCGSSLDVKYTGIGVHRLYDCLAVLLQNANLYGSVGRPIIVQVNSKRSLAGPPLDIVEIEVKSFVDEEKFIDCKRRITDAIESVETGTDMVTEGYSGIKKIKFITRASEGKPTISFELNEVDKELLLRFSLHAEVVSEESTGGI